MSNSSVCSILDIPDEILVKIFLHFNARERLALGNSCQRFNNLVFGDEELLRNLDFNRGGYGTKESDVQQYFNNENTYKKILRMNAEHVKAPASSLGGSISKAINLVELNILWGLQFRSMSELACLLKPLVHLKLLSVNWPEYSSLRDHDTPNCEEVIEESLSKLTYLSLKIRFYANMYLQTLKFCQQLEELRMWITKEVWCSDENPKSIKLGNLKFVKLIADESLERLRRHIMTIVPDPAEWTEFYPFDPDNEVYLEKNVEVCAELSQVKEMPLPQYVAHYRGTRSIDKGWPLVYENLLSEVIRVTHEDTPKKFCCLSLTQDRYDHSHLLEINEAKKLLKDSEYQISCLHLSHAIEKNCDSHLLASAFPGLTTLVLPWISNKNSMSAPEISKPLSRRLRRKGSLASEKDSNAKNTDSSFAIFIENTPLLKVLTIGPEYRTNENFEWDLDAFCLISHWKNLTVIRLRNIPITDGKFLIDIGRECKKLEEVELYIGRPLGILASTSLEEMELYNLSPDRNCRYESKLLQMLQHCKSLRKLTIQGMRLKHTSEMFGVLSNCSRLEDLDLEGMIEECDLLEVVSSIEKMLRRCPQLRKFRTHCPNQNHEFEHAVERIVSELNRPYFQLNGRGWKFN